MHQAVGTSVKRGTGLLPGRRAMPQHHPYVLLFKMADGLQCPFFFRCQRYHAQGVLRNGNQLIQLGNFQLAKQLRRMRAFILRREVWSFEITPQHLRTRSVALATLSNTFQRRMNGIKRRGYGGR